MENDSIEIIDELTEAVETGDSDAIVAAIDRVEQNKARAAIPLLVEVLRSDSRISIKATAALALRELHADEAVPVLIRLLTDRKYDDEDGTFVYALQTMNWYRDHALEVAILVTDKSFEVRLMALQALQEVADQLSLLERANCIAGLVFPVAAGRKLTEEAREMMLEALGLLAEVPETAQLMMSA